MHHGVPKSCVVMVTTWVVTEKTDHLSKTENKVKSRLCTTGNGSEEFFKDSIQFESPTCGRDTVYSHFSLQGVGGNTFT